MVKVAMAALVEQVAKVVLPALHMAQGQVRSSVAAVHPLANMAVKVAILA